MIRPPSSSFSVARLPKASKVEQRTDKEEGMEPSDDDDTPAVGPAQVRDRERHRGIPGQPR